MQTISLNSLAAAHTAASAIVGHGGDFTLTRGDLTTGVVAADRDFTEFRLYGADSVWASCTVTVERPGTRFGHAEPHAASVNFSSAASGIEDTVAFAQASADLIAFAAQVAATLNEWLAAGQLAA